MSGTPEGGYKAADTNRQRYGENYYVERGREGGKKGTTGGFYQNRELASLYGKLGGSHGRNGEGSKLDKKQVAAIHEQIKLLKAKQAYDTTR